MTKNFVLFTGYLDRGRAESYHAKSRLENSLEQVVKNSNIDYVVVAFWNDDRLKDLVKYPNDSKKISLISMTQLNDPGDGNYLSQMESFNQGILKICNICDDINIDHRDVKIFKTRYDGIVSDECFNFVFSLDDSIVDKDNDKILNFKIWNPWFFLNKPFYMEDSFFSARLCDIFSLHNIRQYSRESIGQGITHIRRFISPFLDKFPILKDYMCGKYGLTNRMNRTWTSDINNLSLEERKYLISLLSLYYYILNKYFNIQSEPGYIKHYEWHDSKNWKTRGSEILGFSELNNPKFGYGRRGPPGDIYMYSNKWISNLLDGNFLPDMISYQLMENMLALEAMYGKTR